MAWWWPASKPVPEALPESDATQTAKAAATGSSARRIIRAIPGENRPVSTETAGTQIAAVEASPVVSKVERLEQIRANFNTLAGGDTKTALAAAHQIKDEGEREVALLTLVTAWRHGELSPPRQRANAIASFGLEAGLGFEL